jgi:tetratricopeptide (TPR) repeat protein
MDEKATMAKSNRQRKLDRAKRQVKEAQKQAVAERRLAAVQMIEDLIARHDRLLEPGASVAQLASWLEELYVGSPVPIPMVERMLATGSLERLAEVAEAALASGDAEGSAPSLTALTFAAEVAHAEGKAERSCELLDQALAVLTDDLDWRIGLVDHLRQRERLADSITLLEATLRDTPDDDRAREYYGTVIQEAYKRADHQQPADQCSCGRGASWDECCGPREGTALARFTDRSGITAFSDAVAAFLASSAYGRAIDNEVAEFVAAFDDLDLTPDELAVFRALLAEHALLRAKLPADDFGNEGDQEAGEAGPLAAFAADPSVPRALAAKADTWRTNIHYGLWRIDDRTATPGLWCIDLCSGVARYATFPAQLMSGWPRWSVWLGGLVPVDGIWHATGTGLRLSPTEGDAVAEFVLTSSESVVDGLLGKKKRPTRRDEPIRFGHADPIGVEVDWRDSTSRDMTSVIGMVIGYMLPRIVGEVYLHRWTPPALRNGDGDEMCLITAEITVNDSEQLLNKLAARPGFERDPGDPARIIWYSIRMAPADIKDPAEPQRQVRGTLSVVGVGQILADVNSDERLARLLDVLSKVGADPLLTNAQRVDPTQELASPASESARPRGSAPSGEGWEKLWLDEHLPALGGRTPREAAEGKRNPVLEALLRQFEYESGLLTAQGQQSIDTDWLRQELGFADDPVEERPEQHEQPQPLPD